MHETAVYMVGAFTEIELPLWKLLWTNERMNERTNQRTNEKEEKPFFLVCTRATHTHSVNVGFQNRAGESAAAYTWCKIDCWRRTEDDAGMLCDADSTTSNRFERAMNWCCCCCCGRDREYVKLLPVLRLRRQPHLCFLQLDSERVSENEWINWHARTRIVCDRTLHLFPKYILCIRFGWCHNQNKAST